MFLLNPSRYHRKHNDPQSEALARKTIEFFEKKGLEKIKEEEGREGWYQDFLDFNQKEGLFSTHLTPSGYGRSDARWDMWRISHINEILGFYGMAYWYAWQVSILGLGPVWMSRNEELKKRVAGWLADGGLFGFGLSEKAHGADIYSTDMILDPLPGGKWSASGSKYYIGNGNVAALLSTFGKFKDSGEYVFFGVKTDHAAYHLAKKIRTSGARSAYVAAYDLNRYPVTEADILSKGQEAWDSALNTVNVGKFQLGFCSIGISTHAFYEALDHASGRTLYGMKVTDFPHVRRTFVEAYARLVAMKLYGLRATDYLRSASENDRRYLMFNPIMKMKVTSQGEKVVGLLHEIIAAKGFEQDTYFETAIRDIGALPKLEGTTHVNMALVIKFTKNYFFGKGSLPEIPRRDDVADDTYLFRQKAGGLQDVQFGDYRKAFEGWSQIRNLSLFQTQIEALRKMLMQAPPTKEQAGNVDFMLASGELLTLVAYSQLVLESAKLERRSPQSGASSSNTAVDDAVLEQIFAFVVRDFAGYALAIRQLYDVTPDQGRILDEMISVRPVQDSTSLAGVWDRHVSSLRGVYPTGLGQS